MAKKIVLTGGGTAGHVTPNIALLPSLREAGYEIYYIGSYDGIEARLIKEQKIPYYGIASGKLRSYVTDFPSDEMLGVDKVVCIPHLGASTPESEENCAVMAANELMDYLENGNVNNSVNFGGVDLGRKGTGARICVFNRNVPKMIGRITSTISEAGLNIENMANKASGEVAYMLIELSEPAIDDSLAEKLNAIDGIIRVRAIQ